MSIRTKANTKVQNGQLTQQQATKLSLASKSAQSNTQISFFYFAFKIFSKL
jgi:hypothetical protein